MSAGLDLYNEIREAVAKLCARLPNAQATEHRVHAHSPDPARNRPSRRPVARYAEQRQVQPSASLAGLQDHAIAESL